MCRESTEPVPESTLKTYLSDFMKEGSLFDAGKGWYSVVSAPLELTADRPEEIVDLLSKKFPFLEASCWSTEQVNPFMHHVMTRFTTFVSVERDAMDVVGEALKAAGFDVLVNPHKGEVEKFYYSLKQPALVRPSITKEPSGGKFFAPPEKILIDLLIESENLALMSSDEAGQVVFSAVESGRVNMTLLQSYAARRKIRENIYQAQNNQKSGLGR